MAGGGNKKKSNARFTNVAVNNDNPSYYYRLSWDGRTLMTTTHHHNNNEYLMLVLVRHNEDAVSTNSVSIMNTPAQLDLGESNTLVLLSMLALIVCTFNASHPYLLDNLHNHNMLFVRFFNLLSACRVPSNVKEEFLSS